MNFLSLVQRLASESGVTGNASAITWLLRTGVSLSSSPQRISVGTPFSTLSASSLSCWRKVSKNSVITSTGVAATIRSMKATREGGTSPP